jgi:hypothetical protein
MQLKCNLTLPPPNHLVKIGTIMPITAPLLVAKVYVFFFDLSLPIDLERAARARRVPSAMYGS